MTMMNKKSAAFLAALDDSPKPRSLRGMSPVPASQPRLSHSHLTSSNLSTAGPA